MKNLDYNKCLRIKRIIEKISGIKDIGARTRVEPYPEMKQIYCKLCKEFTKASLSTIAKTLGYYDHSTTLHHVRKFDDLFSTNGLEHIEIYNEMFKMLTEEKNIFKARLNSKNLSDKETILMQSNEINMLKDIIFNQKLLLNKVIELNEMVSKSVSEVDIYNVKAKIKSISHGIKC